MKYFEMNLGDYAEATSHLTLLEDAVYFRLLRKYYATERPLPADIKAVQRLVGVRSKQEREAVKVVLEEFFILEDDGWHNARCDAEIQKYHQKRDRASRDGGSGNDRSSGGSDRLHRHREERRQLMAALRQRGINPAWDTPVPKLREMLDQAMAQSKQVEPETPPETHLKRQPETPETLQPITNNQEPRTNNQEPRTKEKTSFSDYVVGVAASADDTTRRRAKRLPDDWQLPKSWGEWALSEFPHWTEDIVRREAEKFADYWRSRSGKEAAKLDWQATWRNWCRSDITQRAYTPKRITPIPRRFGHMSRQDREIVVGEETQIAKSMLFGAADDLPMVEVIHGQA